MRDYIQADTVDKRSAAKAALRDLLRPVRGRLWAGRVIGAASALLSIAPYIALVRLGEIFLDANIRVGREGASDADVRAAADLAGVTSIVARLPDGWDSRVGEGGRSLSGGERQRVSIARALLKDSPIVLFDEATSSLDAENEANVVASIDKLRARSTFLVIAHKLDTVQAADEIIVLDDAGRIAERGTHEQLHAAGGAYRSFWDRRAAASGWALAPAPTHESTGEHS